jgi:NAD(P)-dependent dehydrogenase (short-subunit alcohol dehydrogenase family)
MAADERVFLVTGAAKGIGAAVARRLAAAGHPLLLHARADAAGLARVVAETGGVVATMLGDLANPDLPAALVAHALDRFGRLDGIVANAGFADRRPIDEVDPAGLMASLSPMVLGGLETIRQALPVLDCSDAARVVAVSSFVAHTARAELGAFPATAASKAAIEALIRVTAARLAPRGGTANSVAPGFVAKDPGAHTTLTADRRAALRATIPLGRFAEPDEIAAVIAFLCRREASYLTGQVIRVDGGLSL